MNTNYINTPRGVATFIAGVAILCVAAGLISARLFGGVSEEDVHEEIIAALTDNCEVNLKYREQSRERAVINQKSQKLLVESNEALISVLNALPDVPAGSPGYDPRFDRAVDKLGKVLDRSNAQINDLRASSTALLPLPDCDIYKDILNDEGNS